MRVVIADEIQITQTLGIFGHLVDYKAMSVKLIMALFGMTAGVFTSVKLR